MKLYHDCDLWDGDPCSACKDHLVLQAQISEAQGALADDIIKQRAKIRTRINENHDILTTRVPVEIVGSIFQFCVPARQSVYGLEDISYYLWDKKIVSSRLLLGSVCTIWRHIAWETGPLWSEFQFNLSDRDTPNNVLFTKEWLERAGKCPLSLRISCGLRLPTLPKHQKRIGQLIAIINECSNQWQQLDIYSPSRLIPDIIRCAGGAPNLQSLRIRSWDTKDAPQSSMMDGILEPSHLTVEFFPLRCLHVNWTRLTRVCLCAPHLFEAIALLRRAPNVVHCKIDSINRKEHLFLGPDPPILHRALEHLELESTVFANDRIWQNKVFLQSFTFPSLKHLKIQSGRGISRADNKPPWDSVLSHIISSSPALISLSISDLAPHLISGTMLPFLRRASCLRELEMKAPSKAQCDGEQNDFYQLLTDTPIAEGNYPTQPEFLPNLQLLKLYVADEDAESLWEAIPRIFGHITDIHNPPRRPLKTLVARVQVDIDLSCLQIKPKDLFLNILKLRQEGIDLDLTCSEESYDVFEESVEHHGLEASILAL